MSNYNALKSEINNNIYENQTQQITGTVLNTVLNAMTASLGAGYQFAGVATVTTDPGTPDQRVFYVAGEGIYSHFNNLQVPEGNLGFLKWDSQWRLETIEGLGGGSNLTGYVSVATIADLPSEGQPTLGYLVGTNLYVYVGTGGDTADGKYQNCGSFRGPQGIQGEEGNGIASVVQTTTSTEDEGVNIITVTMDDNTQATFQVKNGSKGSQGIQGPQGVQGEPGRLQAQYKQVETLPTASADTVDYIYLVESDTPNVYDMYYTEENQGSYSWQSLGTTAVQLSDYATKTEVSQLEAEVHNLSGKYYGVFADDSDLPEGDIVGYAFVGIAEPLILFTFDGEEWTNTEILISGIVGPQGEEGPEGPQGIQGPPGVTSVVASVDNGTGTPSVDVALNSGILTLTFHNLKGLQGDTGSSVSYPFTIVNNTTTNDATQALSAAIGKLLQDQIDAMGLDVDSLQEQVGNYLDDDVEINVGTWTDNKLIIADPENTSSYGNEYYSSAYACTNFVDIHQHAGRIMTYTRQKTTSATSQAGLCFYDSTKTLVVGSQLNVRSADASGYELADIIIPENAYYVRFSIGMTYKDFFSAYVTYVGEYLNGLGKRVQDLEAEEVSVERNSILIGGNKVIDGVGFNSAIIGKDNTANSVLLHLIEGQTYRLHIINPGWPRTTAGDTSVVLGVRPYINGAYGAYIFSEQKNDTIASYYDFTATPGADYIQLLVRADAGEFIYFHLEKLDVVGPVGTTDEYRNATIALMNKYAERYGAVLSTFMAANGNSKVCAKDMALLCLAAIENNTISSFWGKKVVNAPVFGSNARLDTYESTYTDEDSHPMVADLSDYYHIFGGKTGSGGTPSQGRNLVVAVKSKVDDAWLVGCVLYSTNDVLGDNRFSVMKELFDLLEQHRTGATVDTSSLSCQGAYAFVVPENGNLQNYGDYSFVSVGKNETGIIDSHSIVKLQTAIVATDWLSPYEMLTFTSADPYGGTSGNMYAAGDQLYAIDAIISMVLTSSSIAARCIARYVGQKVLEKNGGAKLYSFRLLNRTAYGAGSQTWLEWLASPDYLVWSAETGLTLSCEGSSSSVTVSNGGSISGVTGGSTISANTIYTK